jgi:hypothetical protein
MYFRFLFYINQEKMKEFHIQELANIAIHYIGNKPTDEGIVFSKSTTKFDSSLNSLLVNYFLFPFKKDVFYTFKHQSDLELNEVFTYAKSIFNDPKSFFENSKNIAKHLYKSSNHPNIKSGELYIVEFKDVLFEGNNTNAIGIFKSESQDVFLKVKPINEIYEIESKRGLNIEKLDKGCIIFNVNSKNGFSLMCVDASSKNLSAQYWSDAFLQIQPRNDDFHQTNQFLGITKQFITKQFPADFETNKADQIDFLNRSVDYFKKHDNFDKQEFENEVLQDESIIKSFKKFDTAYRQDNQIEIGDDFSISAQAVKKQERAFKSVLKLDKNFHIYIHGDRQLIEQGTDTDGRKFYKIYYKDES